MQNCTFRPTTLENTKKKDPARNSSLDEKGGDTTKTGAVDLLRSVSPGNSKNSYLESTWKEIPKVKRHELLYDVAKVRPAPPPAFNEEVKKKREDEELSHCTFQPKMHNSWDNMKDDSFYVGVPRGFKKTVERMHRGKKGKRR